MEASEILLLEWYYTESADEVVGSNLVHLLSLYCCFLLVLFEAFFEQASLLPCKIYIPQCQFSTASTQQLLMIASPNDILIVKKSRYDVPILAASTSSACG